MAEAPIPFPLPARGAETWSVEIAIPVYNEAGALEASVRRLTDYLDTSFPLPWTVTIADNASTDGTWSIATRLAREIAGVRTVHLDLKGRGRALRAVWSASEAVVVAYMDVDLSTDLDALLPLVAPLLSGHSDIAIGTRLAPDSRVVRGPKREFISRTYNFILKIALRTGFSDAQCGFKALRAPVAAALLPEIEDNGWFFDTEMLVLAERNGLRVHEVPVDWADDPDSRVDVVDTARTDLLGVARMLGHPERGLLDVDRLGVPAPTEPSLADQVTRFASVGIVSTLVFAGLFVLLVEPLGPFGADVVALLACSVANTAANRRFTFKLRGRDGRRRHYATGLVLALLPLGLTLGTLAALTASGVTSVGAQLIALTLANATATFVRFGLLRNWVFRR